MIDRLIDKLAAIALPAVLVALFVSVAATGVQTVRLSNAQADLAEERRERAQERALAEAAANAALARNNALQAEHAARQQEATRAFNDALEAQRAAAAAAAADAHSLRDAVECYAAGRCLGATADPITAGTCRDRATALGKLLTRTDRLAGRFAAAADRHADEVRALKRQLEADRAACGAKPDAQDHQ